ncbi:O-antigen ligase family protein [Streptomyces neyagawaensis]|uniref:O-antigen ligase family protein n=1 Tax=Streptomyces neyagawaensis TaxID=42238 RepID=UPI0012FEE02A|nr:O-antigen ligase family protein [Streptomyces neyagawaensis]MCL6738326.1 O-antigen ligase family protein [Streptomyces neyagawaensis]MDE1688165.1 O-antigen ligase family protein [Streptomyces neyagawaensis]
MGILALLSLIPATVALRRARAFGDWDLTSTMVFLVGVLANVPTVVYVMNSGRPERLDPLGEVVTGFPQWVNQIGSVANTIMLAGCVAFVLHRLLSAHARINVAPLIACLLVLLLAFSDALHGQQFLTPRQIALLVALLAAAVARPGRPALLGAAAVVLLSTVLGGVQALIEPATVMRECRADNPCGPLGVLYAGVFTNENIFSLLLIAGIPFVWLGLRGGVRILLACYVAFVAVATGSRLADITAVAVVAFMMILRPRLPEEAADGAARVSLGRVLFGVPVLGAAAAIGLATPLRHPNADSLGDRATIWDMARDELHRSPLLGFGGKAWPTKYHAGEIPAAVSPSLHNQWIDVLYAGGFVGLALFLLLLLCLLLRGGFAGFPVAASVLLPVLLASILERPWSFSISNSLTFALVTAVLVPAAVRRAAAPGVAASGSSPATVLARTPRH